MALGNVRPKLREAVVVGFVVFVVVLLGIALYQYAATAGSLIVLVGFLAGLGYLFYAFAL